MEKGHICKTCKGITPPFSCSVSTHTPPGDSCEYHVPRVATGAYTPRDIAKEAINVFAKYGISIHAVDFVFEAIKEEMSRQAIQSVEIKAD